MKIQDSLNTQDFFSKNLPQGSNKQENEQSLFAEFSKTLESIVKHLKNGSNNQEILKNPVLSQSARKPLNNQDNPPKPIPRPVLGVAVNKNESSKPIAKTTDKDCTDNFAKKAEDKSKDGLSVVCKEKTLTDEDVASVEDLSEDLAENTDENATDEGSDDLSQQQVITEDPETSDQGLNLIPAELLQKEVALQGTQISQQNPENEEQVEQSVEENFEGSAQLETPIVLAESETKVDSAEQQNAHLLAESAEVIEDVPVAQSPQNDQEIAQIIADLRSADNAAPEKTEQSVENLILEKLLQVTKQNLGIDDNLRAVTADSISSNFAALAEALLINNTINQQLLRSNNNAADIATKTPAQALQFDSLSNVRSAEFAAPHRRSESKEEMKNLTKAAESRTMERVDNALKEIARSKDGKTISVRLDPPELGTLKIDVSKRDGAIHARIVAESPAVTLMLKEKAQDVVQMIRKLGLDVEKVSVSVSNDGESNANKSFDSSVNDRGHNQDRSSSENRSNRGQRGSKSDNEVDGLIGSSLISKNKLNLSKDHWVA